MIRKSKIIVINGIAPCIFVLETAYFQFRFYFHSTKGSKRNCMEKSFANISNRIPCPTRNKIDESAKHAKLLEKPPLAVLLDQSETQRVHLIAHFASASLYHFWNHPKALKGLWSLYSSFPRA